ncbi:MAG: ATP synthase F1 subunit epsilon [Terriglobia bacterium]
MADTFLLQLVSPERVLVEEQATEAQVPALDGFIGMLPGHAPLLTELKPGGVFTYTSGGQEKVLAVYGGFVEILPDRVRVLADGAEHREEIDLNAANAQLQQAMKDNEDFRGEASDPAVALDEMMRAQAKVEAALKK